MLLVLVRRSTLQACYGVLHCSLASLNSKSPEELASTSTGGTAELMVPPDGWSYEEYDAIVVSEEEIDTAFSVWFLFVLMALGLED